jgi:hypothetical protein
MASVMLRPETWMARYKGHLPVYISPIRKVPYWAAYLTVQNQNLSNTPAYERMRHVIPRGTIAATPKIKFRRRIFFRINRWWTSFQRRWIAPNGINNSAGCFINAPMPNSNPLADSRSNECSSDSDSLRISNVPPRTNTITKFVA